MKAVLSVTMPVGELDFTVKVVSSSVSHRGVTHSMNELLSNVAEASTDPPKIQAYDESTCTPRSLIVMVVPPDMGDVSGNKDISCKSS